MKKLRTVTVSFEGNDFMSQLFAIELLTDEYSFMLSNEYNPDKNETCISYLLSFIPSNLGKLEQRIPNCTYCVSEPLYLMPNSIRGEI